MGLFTTQPQSKPKSSGLFSSNKVNDQSYLGQTLSNAAFQTQPTKTSGSTPYTTSMQGGVSSIVNTADNALGALINLPNRIAGAIDPKVSQYLPQETPSKGLTGLFAQGVMRGSAATGGALMGLPRQVESVFNPKVDGSIGSFTPQGEFQKNIYGTDQPISFGTEGAILGLKEGSAGATALGGALGIADIATGGGASKLIKNLVKASDVASVTKLLKAEGYADDVINQFAPALARTTDETSLSRAVTAMGKPDSVPVVKTGKEYVAEKNKEVSIRNTAETKEKALSGKMEEKRLVDSGDITIYRAGTGDIKPGEFVTTSKDRLNKYLEMRPGSTAYETSVPKNTLIKGALNTEYVYAPKTISQTDLLFSEARKYKSAEEFVKAKGEPLFHATRDTKMKEFDPDFDYEGLSSRTDIGQVRDYETPYGKVFLTNNLQEAKAYGQNVLDTYFKGKPKITTVKTGDVPPSRYFDDEYNWGKLQEKLDSSEVLKLVDNNGKATYVVSPESLFTKSQLTDLWKQANKGEEEIGSNLSQVDRLIAEGKIRVVRRGDYDVYQVKKGGEWKTARDEDSAVRQASGEKVLKPKAPVSKEVEELQTQVDIAKDFIDDMPGKAFYKYAKPAVYKGQIMKSELPEFRGQVELKSGKKVYRTKWDEKAEDVIAEAFPYSDSYAGSKGVDDAQEALEAYLDARQALERNKRALKEAKAKKPILEKPEVKKMQAKPIQEEEGVVRSIEKQAEQVLGELPPADRVKVPSLNIIIDKTPTSVKRKINVLDYIRTPDRVLKKIGLEKEGELLRKQYEKYTLELPKNIDKITAWSKQVGTGADKRIFRYLDGENLTLSPREKEVAMEIKQWLEQWADRLKLPKDNRISNYITHIFDDQLIAKEFDEDLAKLIRDKIPGQIYDPFLQKRLGAKGYKQDVWQALDAYTKRATRKVHLDEALEQVEKASQGLEESQWKYVKGYIDNVNMRPSEFDNLVDNSIKAMIGYRLGARPTLRVTKFLRQMTFRAMLGLNPSSALRNLSQGVNTYSKLGEKHTIIGYAKLWNKSSMEEVVREGILTNNIIEDRALSATKKMIQTMDKGLFVFFDTAEKINRSAAYLGAKSKGLSQGMSEEKAIEYAKKIVRDTQFSYASIDTPLLLSGDIAKTMGQFQTYTTKQTEFLIEMAKNKEFAGLFRYALAGTAFVYSIGQLFGMEPKELIPVYRFDTPPSLKFPVEVGKAVLDAPDKYGNKRDIYQKLKDVGKTALGLIPGGTQMKKTYEGYQSIQNEGAVDAAGRKQFDQDMSLLGQAQSLTFGKYASKNAKEYFKQKEAVDSGRAEVMLTGKHKIMGETLIYKEDGEVKTHKLDGAEQADEFLAKVELKAKVRPIFDEIILMSEEEAQPLLNALTNEEWEAYKSIRTSYRSKNSKDVRDLLYPDPKDAVELLRTLPDDEAQRILNNMTDEEYARYNEGK